MSRKRGSERCDAVPGQLCDSRRPGVVFSRMAEFFKGLKLGRTAEGCGVRVRRHTRIATWDGVITDASMGVLVLVGLRRRISVYPENLQF